MIDVSIGLEKGLLVQAVQVAPVHAIVRYTSSIKLKNLTNLHWIFGEQARKAGTLILSMQSTCLGGPWTLHRNSGPSSACMTSQTDL